MLNSGLSLPLLWYDYAFPIAELRIPSIVDKVSAESILAQTVYPIHGYRIKKYSRKSKMGKLAITEWVSLDWDECYGGGFLNQKVIAVFRTASIRLRRSRLGISPILDTISYNRL